MPPRSANLLKNHCAKNGLAHWEVVSAGGDGFKCEDEPAGCKKINECTHIKENMGCWATSNGPCVKYQMVNLAERGIRGRKLDNKKPAITVRDWYSPRSDCGSVYKLNVQLLAKDRETVLDEFNFEDTLEQGSDWKKVKHIFNNYPTGVRYVKFQHSGQDTKFWAGHYGAKMTNCGLFVDKVGRMKPKKMRSDNLLKNHCGNDGLNHWEVVNAGGDGFKCEDQPTGCKKINECTHIKENLGCWATSHGPCIKYQLVNLTELTGYGGRKIDNKKPAITVRDWYSPRSDCGGVYKLNVQLLAQDRQTVLDEWSFNDTQEQGSTWKKVKHIFRNYPTGVRYVKFQHGGHDTKNWAGHYGIKITNSGLFVDTIFNNKDTRSNNLLKNPFCKDGLSHWDVVRAGGQGFKCEDQPAGCKNISECTNVKENLGCWATSHGPCVKFQLVDLVESGIRARKLDNKRPAITVRDWYGVRNDCGGEYHLTVELLANDRETVLDTWSFKDTQEAGSNWKKVKHVFRDYPCGVRYVKFQHGGQDTKNWAGHYGIKMTNAGVFVDKKGSRREKPAWAANLGKNLLKNPCANDGLNGWDVVKNGGDGFKAESPISGCKRIKEMNPDAEHESCWATSHGECEKKQLIKLEDFGFNSKFIDKNQPEIQISEWFGSRNDSGCEYWLQVRLLDGDMKELCTRYLKDSKTAEGNWYKAELEISNYGPGVRYIEYLHGGKDTVYWAGNYGAKITCSCVMLVPDDDTSSSSDEN